MTKPIHDSTSSNKPRKHWPLKTLVEIIPIFMALSALLTFGWAQRVTGAELLTPLNRVITALPWWATLLMVAVMAIGVLGIVWVTYIFSRAPVAPDGSDEE
jgi:hypothetical protein